MSSRSLLLLSLLLVGAACVFGAARLLEGSGAPATSVGGEELSEEAPRPRPSQPVVGTSSHSGDVAPERTRSPGHPQPSLAAAHTEVVRSVSATVMGRVLLPDGRGARATVVALVSGAAEALRIATDLEGRFELDPAFAEGVVLAARAEVGEAGELWLAGPTNFGPTEEAPTLVLHSASQLVGVALDDRELPLEEFAVSLTRASPFEPIAGLQAGFDAAAIEGLRFEPKVNRMAGGAFTASGLEPGIWRVTVRAPRHVWAGPFEVAVPRAGPPLRAILFRAGVVRGTVLDPNGTPVAGANIAVLDAQARTEPCVTDDRGAFELALEPGLHMLLARAQDHAPSEAVSVDIAPASEVASLVLRLRNSGRLQIVVQDGVGREIERAAIWARHVDGTCDRWANAVESSATFDALPPGEYALEVGLDVQDGGRVTLRAQAQVTAGVTTRVVVGASAERTIRVHGRVHRRGEGVSAGRITLRRPATASSHSAQLDADGRFELVVDAPGEYEHHVWAEDAGSGHYGRIEVADADEVELDIALPGASVSGIVLDVDGSVCAGVLLELALDPEVADLSGAGSNARTQSGAHGRFAFHDLPAGQYALEYPLAMASDQAGEYATRTLRGIRLETDEQREGLVCQLARPVSLEGVVRDSRSRPVGGARVFVLDARGRSLSRGETQTEANGRYRIDGLPPEALRVLASSDEESSALEGPLDLSGPGPHVRDLRLAPAGRLAVRVFEPAVGAALPREVGAALRVLDDEGIDLGALVHREDLPHEEGHPRPAVVLGPLPPGIYLVRALNHARLAAERSIVVVAGETVLVELVLPNAPR